MNAWDAFLVGSGKEPCPLCLGTGRWHQAVSNRKAKLSLLRDCSGCDSVGWVVPKHFNLVYSWRVNKRLAPKRHQLHGGDQCPCGKKHILG